MKKRTFLLTIFMILGILLISGAPASAQDPSASIRDNELLADFILMLQQQLPRGNSETASGQLSTEIDEALMMELFELLRQIRESGAVITVDIPNGKTAKASVYKNKKLSIDALPGYMFIPKVSEEPEEEIFDPQKQEDCDEYCFSSCYDDVTDSARPDCYKSCYKKCMSAE